jgi:hypothetical protein
MNAWIQADSSGISPMRRAREAQTEAVGEIDLFSRVVDCASDSLQVAIEDLEQEVKWPPSLSASFNVRKELSMWNGRPTPSLLLLTDFQKSLACPRSCWSLERKH